MKLVPERLPQYPANLENLEERILELSVPFLNSDLSPEKRHQVLTPGKGASLEEIVKRLKAPAGETETIMNLSRYMNPENTPKNKIREQVRQYAQTLLSSSPTSVWLKKW